MANENSPDQNNPGPDVPTALTVDSIKAAGIPETYFKDGSVDFAGIATHLTEAQTLKAQAEERAKAVPADGKYDFSVPKDWKKPEGASDEFVKSWKVSEAKISAFAPLAKELGLSQAQVSKVVSGWATADAAEKMAIAAEGQKFYDAEMSKLGANASTRLTNLGNALKANLSQPQVEALAGALNSAAAVEAIEKLINAAGSKMAPKGSQANGKERPDYDKLTPDQLLSMANETAAAGRS